MLTSTCSPGGAGGGWNRSPGNVLPKLNERMGLPLLQGSIGGEACYTSTDGRGDGGFGGGGGGCKVGGGGGGYTGNIDNKTVINIYLLIIVTKL